MIGHRTLQKMIGAWAIAAAVIVPTASSAQFVPGTRSAGQTSYHLVQLSMSSGDAAAQEFASKTQAIESCGDAMDVAQELDADIRRNRFVQASQLPDQIRAMLEELPTGQASEVFGADGETLRVLVICNRL